MKTLFVLIFIFTAGLFILNSSNDRTRINKNDSRQFPDHSVKKLGVEIEYPAPMKQLQQVLTHSYVNPPSDEPSNIDVALKELHFQTSNDINDESIEQLQSQINQLRTALEKEDKQ